MMSGIKIKLINRHFIDIYTCCVFMYKDLTDKHKLNLPSHIDHQLSPRPFWGRHSMSPCSGLKMKMTLDVWVWFYPKVSEGFVQKQHL